MTKYKTPEYKAWSQMKYRCNTPTANEYDNYGGRGISVCEEWQVSFENFLRDMGLRPANGFSIERRDNNGNYNKANCYWATREQQERNKRNNRLLTVNGVTKPLVVWATERGLPFNCIWMRLYNGWTAEQAVQTPKRGTK